jgi:hypothetical protein
MEEMYASFKRVVKGMGREFSDVLFVPYSGYKAGDQFRESLYHYVAGLAFRDAGYLVLDEYKPSLVSGGGYTPDVSAFRSREIAEGLAQLKGLGVISCAGAFAEELQLDCIFGRQDQGQAHAHRGIKADHVENVAVEVKRSESQYLIDKGSNQLRAYMSSAYGFYDEGFVAGPFLKGRAAIREGQGVVSLDHGGRLVFERGPPSTSTAVNDSWAPKREQQMQEVRCVLKREVLKNVGLSGMVDACGGKEKVRTYLELEGAVCKLDMKDAIEAVRRGR